ncbi:MAG: class I SAM-dependent methyltransferase [Terracidiphilus sp.]
MNLVQSLTPPQIVPWVDVLLCCPRCRITMDGDICPRCSLQIDMKDGIALALAPERAKYYAPFTHAYESIRRAEGRGSATDDFYLRLPWNDLSGRNTRQWRIRSRSFDYLMTHVLPPQNSHGYQRVLDVGAGNCWLSFRLSRAGYRPVAVDLSLDDLDGLRAAEHYRGTLPDLFPRFQAEMDRLPFADGQFDVAIFNASFHYSESTEATLREALRCLKSNGRVIVVDTPWYSSEKSGQRMLQERRATFLRKFGTASDAIEHLEYLTNERLQNLAAALSIHWERHSPRYGLGWTMRPLMARLQRKREPSQFRIYVAHRKP